MEKYKTVNRDNLRDYGIAPLTGEACTFGMRTLCDLSTKGIELLQDFYGFLPDKNPFPRNMNSRVGDEPAVASCMISAATFPDLYLFILMAEGFEVILCGRGECVGMSREVYEETKKAWPADALVRYNYRVKGQPHVGSRNVHALTGRVL